MIRPFFDIGANCKKNNPKPVIEFQWLCESMKDVLGVDIEMNFIYLNSTPVVTRLESISINHEMSFEYPIFNIYKRMPTYKKQQITDVYLFNERKYSSAYNQKDIDYLRAQFYASKKELHNQEQRDISEAFQKSITKCNLGYLKQSGGFHKALIEFKNKEEINRWVAYFINKRTID